MNSPRRTYRSSNYFPIIYKSSKLVHISCTHHPCNTFVLNPVCVTAPPSMWARGRGRSSNPRPHPHIDVQSGGRGVEEGKEVGEEERGEGRRGRKSGRRRGERVGGEGSGGGGEGRG